MITLQLILIDEGHWHLYCHWLLVNNAGGYNDSPGIQHQFTFELLIVER